MRFALNIVFFIIGLCSTQAWCLAKTQHMTAHATSSQVVFSLPANPTTGYQWVLKAYNKSLLKLEKKGYQVSSKLIGAPGNMTWVFKIQGKKVPSAHTEIILEYKRPWQADIIKVMKVDVILSE